MFNYNDIMIDFKVADKYLGKNNNLYITITKSFLNSYKDFSSEVVCNKISRDELYLKIHSLKGITLNLGMVKLYNQCNNILPIISNKEDYSKEIKIFLYIFNKTYKELNDYFLTTNCFINSSVGSI